MGFSHDAPPNPDRHPAAASPSGPIRPAWKQRPGRRSGEGSSTVWECLQEDVRFKPAIGNDAGRERSESPSA